VYSATDSTITLIDTVPGGAGYARLINSNLETVLARARQLVAGCECGSETSCYMCLRTFSNQRLHDELSRGEAIRFLDELWGSSPGPVPGQPAIDDAWEHVQQLADASLAAVLLALATTAPTPQVGTDIGPANEWIVELVWGAERLAVVIDADIERDAWLVTDGWTVLDASPGFRSDELTTAIRTALGIEGAVS
jgi:hypothetical protein